MSRIDISVKTKYLGKQQDKSKSLINVFSYTVTIKNSGEQAVTLKSRYWLITNGDGEKIEVSGDGVVGEQPRLQPDEVFEYTSASMIKTSVGTMEGYYNFEFDDGRHFKAPIKAFTLAQPNSLH